MVEHVARTHHQGVIVDTPQTTAGVRVIDLDKLTVKVLRRHQDAQVQACDSELVFPHGDGGFMKETSITLDTYSHMLPGWQQEVADAVAGAIADDPDEGPPPAGRKRRRRSKSKLPRRRRRAPRAPQLTPWPAWTTVRLRPLRNRPCPPRSVLPRGDRDHQRGCGATPAQRARGAGIAG